MTNVTIKAIRDCYLYEYSCQKLLQRFGKTEPDDEPLPLRTIFEMLGLDDALWCLRALPSHWEKQVRLLAFEFAESVLKYVPENEDRPAKTIATARAFARGEASLDQLIAARDAAWDARDVSWDAAYHAAQAAASTTKSSASASAYDAAWSAIKASKNTNVVETIFIAWLNKHETQETKQ